VILGALVVLALLGVVVALVVSRCGPEEEERQPDGPSDAAAPVEDAGLDLEAADAARPPDSRARRRRPRPTRRITEPELRRVQRRHSATVRICYRRAARRAPSMVARRANVTVDLADYGRVQSVTVEAGGDRELEGCIRRAVRGWRFSTTLKQQKVKFPVVFR